MTDEQNYDSQDLPVVDRVVEGLVRNSMLRREVGGNPFVSKYIYEGVTVDCNGMPVGVGDFGSGLEHLAGQVYERYAERKDNGADVRKARFDGMDVLVGVDLEKPSLAVVVYL